MLVAQNILSPQDGAAIAAGLDQIQAEIEGGRFAFSEAHEDIHLNVEARLAELIGPAAGRLHTARSRNDQVATDLRLWLRAAIDRLDAAMQRLAAGADRPRRGPCRYGDAGLHPSPDCPAGDVGPSPDGLCRDGRARPRAACRLPAPDERCPLGAAALAGTSFPIDRAATAAALGFDRPAANSLDAVSDRDFAVEFLAAAALAGTHLSRLAEEIVLWCSDGFGFIALTDAFTTGSSIMPQKRNPDAAELVRAKTGRLNGALIALLTVMKGLPLAYRRICRKTRFRSSRQPTRSSSVSPRRREWCATCGRIGSGCAKRPSAATPPRPTSPTGWCASAGCRSARRTMPTGPIVKRAEELGCALAELPLAELQAVEPDDHRGRL